MKNFTGILREPKLEDGIAMYTLAMNSEKVDPLSQYGYLLFTQHFKETTAVAEKDGQVVGYLFGYIMPKKQDTLFLWQMEIHQSCQKLGLSLALAREIIERPFCDKIQYICGTVEEGNVPSRAFLKGLGRSYGCELQEKPFFLDEHFAFPHDDEPMIYMGPIQRGMEN